MEIIDIEIASDLTTTAAIIPVRPKKLLGGWT